MLEVEIKLRIASPAAARARLEASGWIGGDRLFERNTVYDAPGNTLHHGGKLLRIRETSDRAVLTLKLPAASAGPHKVREEYNLDGHGPTLESVVAGLGFLPAWRYEKYRTRYRKSGEAGVIELDETPVGTFLELEGPPQWIDATAAALGFPVAEYITTTYRELFLAWRAQQASPPSDMVFVQQSPL